MQHEKTIYTGVGDYGSYTIKEKNVLGRFTRALYSDTDKGPMWISGLPLDDGPELIASYNQMFFDLVEASKPADVLVIGGGVYTLPRALVNAFPQIRIDVVEPDPLFDELATQFFEFTPSERLRIFHTDGLSFLRQTKRRYDFILIDAFDHFNARGYWSPPASLTSVAAVKQLHRHLLKGGRAAMNIAASYWGPDATEFRECCKIYESVFSDTTVYQMDSSISPSDVQNLVLVAGKNAPTASFSHHDVQSLSALSAKAPTEK